MSVIMPCYNAGSFVKQAIQSVLNQTHKNLELIIINDGSNDNSENIIKAFVDERIKYFKTPNQGQCKSSNYGLSKAVGEYIKFLDADDIINETHIENLLKVLDGSETAIASCAWARFYEGDISLAQLVPTANWRNVTPLDWIKMTMNEMYDMMPGWLWLIPKKLLAKAGGWDERLSLNNDFEFSVRLVLNSSAIYFSSEAIHYYRSGNDKTLSSIVTEQSYKAAILSARLGCTQLLLKENSANMRQLCANKYCYWLHRIYPSYPSLVKELEMEVKALGGSNRKIDESPLMHKLQKLLGWKGAKRIKIAMYKLGYEKHLLTLKKKLFPPSISIR